MEGLRIHYVKPVCPGDVHVQGDVTVAFWIDRSGAVVKARVIEGNPMLVQAALEAVKQWKYQPYFLNGEPVDVETTAVVSFGE